MQRKYLLKPDRKNINKRLYRPALRAIQVPETMDLRSQCPAIYDQTDMGTCACNAGGAGHEFCQMKEKLTTVFMPSRLFIYWQAESVDGNQGQDQGTTLADVVNSLENIGVCPETMWQYLDSNLPLKPTPDCYTNAVNNVAVQASAINQDINDLLECIASGYPFICGLQIYSSFESEQVASTGIVPMPKKSLFGGYSETLLGGHALLFCGYDQNKQIFIGRNSWGTSWGMNGYFTIPFAYILDSNLTSDIWTIRSVL